MVRPKRVPQRLCVGCRQMVGKRELIRIVRTPDGAVNVDPTGRQAGRGAYLCRNSNCLTQAVRSKRLEQALHKRIDDELLARLREEIEKRESDI